MKKRNIIFDHLRALSMLGVVAIHVGDLVMQSGTPWNWLYLLCEVLSRYRKSPWSIGPLSRKDSRASGFPM